MIHLSHPTGNRNVREALAALDDAGQLARFTTTVAWRGGIWDKVLPARLTDTLKRRNYSDSILSKTRTHPAREIARLLFSSRLGERWTKHETGSLSVDAVQRNFDEWVATTVGNAAVYCYEDTARDTFLAAKAKGLKRIYEHPVGYWRYVEKVFGEESELQPEYRSILPGLNDSAEKKARKDEEIGMADLLILSSNYSLNSLSLYPGTLPPVAVIPYGAPSEPVSSPRQPGNKLRVIFVGGLQQVKGLSYLVEALTRVQDLVEVTIIGRRVADCLPLDRFLASVTWVESVPHARVLELMRESDVLVLPSLTDGFGLVVLEAMSQGLTALVSDHAGVADVIEEGVNGFVTPVRGVDPIVGHLETLAREPDRLMAMKAAALQTAANYTWERYREALLAAVATVV